MSHAVTILLRYQLMIAWWWCFVPCLFVCYWISWLMMNALPCCCYWYLHDHLYCYAWIMNCPAVLLFFNLPRNPCGSWLVCIVCGYLVCCIIVMIICCYSFVVFDRMPMPLPNPNCCMNFLKHESWLVVLLFHWPLANENISFSCTKRWVLVKWVQNYTITILWLVFDH